MLSLYNYKFIDENLNIENNINIEEDNDFEDIELDDIINKTDKINLNDSMDVDANNDYLDEDASIDMKNKKIKKEHTLIFLLKLWRMLIKYKIY